MRPLFLLPLASLLLLAATGTARADAPPPAAATPSAPDVVTLRDGSLFRGTIAELVTGDHVDLVLLSGSTRRFAMREVAYAGPAASMPSTPPPPPTSAPPTPDPGAAPPPPPGAPPPPPADAPFGSVRIEADEPGVTFQLRTGEESIQTVGWSGGRVRSTIGTALLYRPICTAPCQTTVPMGYQHIGLSRGDASVVEPDQPVNITGPGTLHGEIHSRQGARVAGWLLFFGSAGGGAALIVASLRTENVCTSDGFGGGSNCIAEKTIDGGLMGAGIATMLVGGLVGLGLTRISDHAEISFVPLAPASLGGRREGAAPLDPRGFQISARF